MSDCLTLDVWYEVEPVQSELGCFVWSELVCGGMSGDCLVHGGVSGPSGMEGSRLSGLSLDDCCEDVRPEAGMSSLILSKLKPSRQDRSEPGLLVWKCSASA